VASIAPDALNHWKAISDMYDAHAEQIVGMRDVWIRRRNLFRALESNLKTRLELGDASQAQDNRRRVMKESGSDRVLIIHGHDERNLLALKDLLQTKLRLPEPVVMAQQMLWFHRNGPREKRDTIARGGVP
jgi:hypothetical protein